MWRLRDVSWPNHQLSPLAHACACLDGCSGRPAFLRLSPYIHTVTIHITSTFIFSVVFNFSFESLPIQIPWKSLNWQLLQTDPRDNNWVQYKGLVVELASLHTFTTARSCQLLLSPTHTHTLTPFLALCWGKSKTPSSSISSSIFSDVIELYGCVWRDSAVKSRWKGKGKA